MALGSGIVSDVAAFLEVLAERVGKRKREAWVAEIAKAKQAFQGQIDIVHKQGIDNSAKSGLLHPACIARD